MFRRSLALPLSFSLALGWCDSPPAFAQVDPAAPAVEGPKSPLPREPETPEEFVDAALLMMQLTRPELSKRYLQGLLELNPDDAALLQVRNRFGSATFQQLSRVEELQPESVELLNRINAAAITQLNDPAFIDGVVAKLGRTAREREEAIREIRFLGPAAVPAILQRISDPERKDQRDLLIYTLTKVGTDSAAPLIATLDAPDPALQGIAAETLGWVGDDQALPYLYTVAFAPEISEGVRTTARQSIARIIHGDRSKASRVTDFGVVARLLDRSLELFGGQQEATPGDDGLVGAWVWDQTAGAPVEHRMSARSAALYQGEKLARNALRLSPERHGAQVAVLAFAMSRDVHQAGWDQPIPEGPGTAHDVALAAGSKLVADVLTLALDHNNAAAALSAARVLGQNGARGLATESADTSPLTRALDAPDQRVQFEAAAAVLQLDPDTPFSGSRRVVEILARALHANSQKLSVVIDPNGSRGAAMASYLQGMGYQAGLAPTGREGFLLASERGDVELAVLHVNTIRWELSQTVANLRADARTAGIPIAIYGPRGLQPNVGHLLNRGDGVFYIEESNDSFDLIAQLQPQIEQQTPPPLTQAQRSRQIATAAAWLRHIARGQRTRIYDLTPVEDALADAIDNPQVAVDAVIALATVPRATVQTRLFEASLAPGYDPLVRETAALELAAHIRRHGGLLDEDQRRTLVSAWESEENPALQTALSTIVGVLQPEGAAVLDQLQPLVPGDAAPAGTAPAVEPAP